MLIKPILGILKEKGAINLKKKTRNAIKTIKVVEVSSKNQ